MSRLLNIFRNNENQQRTYLKFDAHKYLGTGMLLMFLIFLASVYLSPLLYMGSMSLQPQGKPGSDPHPLIPSALRKVEVVDKAFETADIRYREPLTFEYEGETYPVYDLELADSSRDGAYALLGMDGERGRFVNIETPDAEPVLIGPNDLAEPQPIEELRQATGPRQNLTLNLYDVSIDGARQTMGLLEVTDDTITWINPDDTSQVVEQPTDMLPDAQPLLNDVVKLGIYNYTIPDTYEYEGEEYPVVLIAYPSPRPTRYAVLEDRGDSATVLNTTMPGAEPIEVGPQELNNTPIDKLQRAETHYKGEAEIYKIEVGGEVRELGLIETYDDGTSLWMDPAKPAEPPFELDVDISQATLVYAISQAQIFEVPMPDGGSRELAQLQHEKDLWLFVDPDTDEALSIKIREGKLDKLWAFEWHPENYVDALEYGQFNFFQLFRNTVIVSVVGGLGAMVSATLVAYGFTRFNIPYGNILFIILLSTIMLPPQVTQIPLYVVFQEFGWIGTLLPLIVPHFFSNAYNVFLLRQYMMGIPRELDDAARVDGANPFQILWYVIIPASRPALAAVYLFHFLFAWNDFANPLIYVGQGNMEKQVLAVGLQGFSQIYSDDPQLMMAAGVMTMVVPLLIFFAAQRIFMQGVVITGVEK